MSDFVEPPARIRPLGTSGIEVSSIAWGMWRFYGDDVAGARHVVETALAAEITLLDTADIYGEHHGFGASERLLGRVLSEAPTLRDRMVLATKGGIRPGAPYDSRAAWLAEALDGSLRRLCTERIDLYQIHRPDLLAHPQEAARALDDARMQGKIRAIGVSNYSVAQLQALASFLPVPIVSQQPEFSPLHVAPMFDGVLDQAMERDMAVLAWSPIGGGRLMKPASERDRAVAELLDVAAETAGVDRAAAAYAWLMAHPARPIPILGTQDVARIARAGDAYRVRWSRADWYRVLEASLGRKMP
ncbi:aldo/keto reductase [Sphingomonas oryzagri]